MTAPVISSVSFDKPSYNPGDVISCSVAYTPGSSPPAPLTETLSGTATDTASGATAPFSGTFVVQPLAAADATTWAVTDTGGRTWATASDSGTVAVFTATA